MDADDLAKHNESKHEVNHAAGFCFYGRTIGPVKGAAVDREQVHHMLIADLAGPAAGWIYGGESQREAKPSRKTREEIQQHADGSDDFSRVWRLLWDVDPLYVEDALEFIPEDKRGQKLTDEEARSVARSAYKPHEAELLEQIEQLWREATAFVAEKWPQVQAVADALWKKRSLSGGEITDLIEQVEDRLQALPPSVEKLLKSNPAPAKPEEK
jgi:hypothetical protein